MSAYENVVSGKLKLKGKALDVKAGGVKKKNKSKKHYEETSESLVGEGVNQLTELSKEEVTDDAIKEEEVAGDESGTQWSDQLTPAERRYIEQRERIDAHKLKKTSNKSHRDRIEDFNQYLANMSEHYDIPKVGPG